MARLILCWFDSKLLQKMQQLGVEVHLLKHYVNDCQVALIYDGEQGVLKTSEAEMVEGKK